MLEAKELYHQQVKKRQRALPLEEKKQQVAVQGVGPQTKLKLVGMVFCCFLLALAVVVQYSRVVGTTREISGREREIAQIQDNNRRLQLEVSRLSSLQRIEEIAVNELGMRRPESGQVVIVSEENQNIEVGARPSSGED